MGIVEELCYRAMVARQKIAMQFLWLHEQIFYISYNKRYPTNRISFLKFAISQGSDIRKACHREDMATYNPHSSIFDESPNLLVPHKPMSV
eukprot:scaffold1137_cov392-Pavlova_lutheri.AAC.21